MDNTLTHHGILGQKWGIRRFQPYPAGHKGGKEVGEAAKDSKLPKSLKNKIAIAQKKSDYKYRATLSDDDLEKKIKRLKMEKELRELTEREISFGKIITHDVIREAGQKAAKTALTGTSLFIAKRIAESVFDSKELGDAIFNGGPKKK